MENFLYKQSMKSFTRCDGGNIAKRLKIIHFVRIQESNTVCMQQNYSLAHAELTHEL